MTQSIVIAEAATYRYGCDEGQHDIPHKPTLSRLCGCHIHIVNHLLFRHCMDKTFLPGSGGRPVSATHSTNPCVRVIQGVGTGDSTHLLYVCQCRSAFLIIKKDRCSNNCEGVTAKSLLRQFSARQRSLPDITANDTVRVSQVPI